MVPFQGQQAGQTGPADFQVAQSEKMNPME